MSDPLADIKTNYTDQDLGCLLSEGQILWLVTEVERLRLAVRRLRADQGALRGQRPVMTSPDEPALPGKLVRDLIPAVIREAGLVPVTVTAALGDRDRYARAKLREELNEYLSSGDVEELADLIEACFAAAAAHGVSRVGLLEIARDKRARRGGFDRWLVWLGNEPGSADGYLD